MKERTMPRLFWVFIGAMLASWIAMNFWTVPRIEELSGGLRLLDMRFTGYSHEDVKEFVAAIGEEGADLYLGTQLWLDMVFPPLLAAVLFLTYRWLYIGPAGTIIGSISLLSVIVDYLENAAIAIILRSGANGITVEMAAAANQWTVIKWSFSAIGLAALLVGVMLRLRRHRRCA